MARYIRKKKQSTVAAWHLMGNSHSYFSIPLLPALVILILPYSVAIADEVYKHGSARSVFLHGILLGYNDYYKIN